MATTSPYQQNDYQAVGTYRPYRLPVNDIIKGLSAQNQFWDEGARRIKSYYDNALGLDLTLDENKGIRKQFMTDAEKQIAKLSTMNVADPSVQKKGIAIFDPLFQDDAIAYDDFLTKKQRQIFSDADRYKRDQKTKGEGYHTDNLMYALNQFEGFGRSSKRSDLQGIYEKAKNAEYIPFHDVSKEYLDIASKCKPDKMASTSVQGLYFQNIEDNSQTVANLQGCIKSSLSDKAWQQLRITGSVRYGKDYNSIAQGYSSILADSSRSYAKTLIDLAAEKNKLKDLGKLTPELEQAYDEHEGNVTSIINRNNVVLNKLNSGDFSEIEKNYDSIVAQVYANQDIGGFAEAFAYKDYSEKITANAAGIAQMREGGENARFNTRLQFDAIKFQIEQQQKAKENDINLLKTLMGGADGKGGLLGMGMDYEVFSKFIKPIGERLGIDLEGIGSYLDEGKVIEGVGETYDSIMDKANKFHYDRMQATTGILNILKQVLPEESIKKLYSADGRLLVKDVYKAADDYLTTYHKSGNEPNSQYAKNIDNISELENLVNQYQHATNNVFQFMRMRDNINAKIDSNPELKKYVQDYNNKISNTLKGMKNFYFFKDARKNQEVHFFEKDLEQLANGTHADYTFNKDGNLVYKSDGSLVQGGNRTNDDVRFTSNIEKQTGREAIISQNGKGVMGEIGRLYVEKQKKLQPQVGEILKDIVRNTNIYNVGNVPGLGNSIKQKLTFISDINSSEYQVRPENAYKDNQGNPVTTFKVWKKTKVKDDDDVTNNEWVDVTDDVKSKLGDSNMAVGGSNEINIQNGELTVKTPYLPMFQGNTKYTDYVNNEIYAAKKLEIGYQQKVPVEVSRVQGTGGVKIGFDIIGGGKSFSGNKNPDSYKTWILLPDGTKEYIGDVVYSENQVANQLGAIETQLPSILSKKK